jgi:hypothetical protein
LSELQASRRQHGPAFRRKLFKPAFRVQSQTEIGTADSHITSFRQPGHTA